MTDTPGHEPAGPEPEPEQRLPATRPPAEVAPVERFTSPPSIRAVELTPERAAQVVRQSSNARWIGFLAVVVVILFVALYWFYELGAPLGLTEPRLKAEITAQQITMVERGYNVYQANCARCHGKQGEGGIGPVLNKQDKLFSHLNEAYIRNVLTSFSSPFYGPVAFGTSARSSVLTDWPGGGFIGIHGTNAPELLPGRISHGCIRLRNEDIVRLWKLMPVGTPLTIQ